MLSIFLLILGLMTPTALVAEQATLAEAKQIKPIMQTIKQLCDDAKNQIWPGYCPADQAIYLNFPSQHRLFALYFQPKSSYWQQITVAGKPIFYTEQDPWNIGHLRMTPNVVIDEQRGFLMQMKHDAFDKDGLLLLHEMFHFYQLQHFKKQWRRYQADLFSETNLFYSAIEYALTQSYLATSDIELIKDLLALRHLRRQSVSRDTLAWENLQQSLEGLADYVSYSAVYQHNRNKIHALLLKKNQHAMVPHMLKWRHYRVGFVLADALDQLAVEQWRQKVMAGQTLISLLEKQLHLSTAEKRRRADALVEQYQPLKRQSQQALDDYKQELEQVDQAFQKHPGTALYLRYPKANLVGGEKAKKSYHLLNGGVIKVDVTGEMHSVDLRWQVNFTHLPYLINRGGALMKIAANPTVNIDGQPRQLRQLKEDEAWHFKTLTLADKTLSLQIKQPGMIARSPKNKAIVFIRTVGERSQ